MRAMKRNRMNGIAVLLLLIGTACGSGGGTDQAGKEQDPSAFRYELKTDPSPPVVGQPVTITAAISGMGNVQGADVQLDIRKSNSRTPDYYGCEGGEGGTFSTSYTFEESAVYTIYLHFYHNGLHITKKTTLEVE